MLAGKLNARAKFWRLPLDTRVPSEIVETWVSIRTKKDGTELPAQRLRSNFITAPVEIRVRYRTDVQAHDYATWNGKLFYIYAIRDPDGKRAELIASADDLVGQPAEYRVAGTGTPKSVRCHVTHDSPYLAPFSQRIDYRTQIDLAIFETGRAVAGDTVKIGTVTYKLLGLVDDGDDGVIRRYWGHV